MKRTLLVLASLLLVSITASLPSAGAASVEHVSWGASGTAAEAAPGDTGKSISVLVRNNATTTYTNVRGTIYSSLFEDRVGDITPTPGGNVATLSGNFAPGDVWTARVTVNIDAEAPTYAVYQLPFTVEMYDRATDTYVTERLMVPLQLTGRAFLDVSTSTAEVVAGETETITLTVRNQGSGLASSVQLTPAAGQGLTLVDGKSVSVGTLRPGESASTTLSVRATQSGATSISAAITYTDSAGSPGQVTRTSSLMATAPSSVLEYVSARLLESQINAGRTSSMTFLIWNNGTSDMQNVQGSVSATGTLVVPDASDQQFLGTIPAGTQGRMVVNVLTDNNARGIQRVPLSLTWKNSDGASASATFNLAVPVVGTVEPSLTSVTATVNNNTGVTTVSGTLTNLGNTQALNANIQLLANANFAATDPQYIGDLDANTAFPFTLATTLLNESLLTSGAGATGGAGQFPQGGAQGGAGGARPGGFSGGNGTSPANFPTGQAPPANGTFARGNMSGGAGGFGARGGADANIAQILLTWNDDYGNTHSQVFSVPVQVRAASTATRTAAAQTTDDGGFLDIPAPSALLILGALGAAAAVAAHRQRRMR